MMQPAVFSKCKILGVIIPFREKVSSIAFIVLAIFLFEFCTNISSSRADNFPSRAVRLIVPTAPGGPLDIAARLIADVLAQKWGQPVLVENRAGGGSITGTAAVANSPLDGYTFLVGLSSALVDNGFIVQSLPYDPNKSFAPVTEVYKISAALSVYSKISAQNIDELVVLARRQSLSYSSFGIGSGPHILVETFKKAAAIDIVHVPYRGSVEGLMGAVGGQVDMTGAGLGVIRPHLASGALRLLAVVGEARSRFAPDTPTFKELGFPSVGSGSQFAGFWAPAGTPVEIIKKVNNDVAEALASSQFLQFLDNSGYGSPTAVTPDQLRQFVTSSIQYWGPVLKSLSADVKLEK